MRLEAVRDYHLKYDGFSMLDIKYQYVLFVFIDIVSICYYKLHLQKICKMFLSCFKIMTARIKIGFNQTKKVVTQFLKLIKTFTNKYYVALKWGIEL